MNAPRIVLYTATYIVRPATLSIPARPFQPRVTQPSALALGTMHFPPAKVPHGLLYPGTSCRLGLFNLDPNMYIALSTGTPTVAPSLPLPV